MESKGEINQQRDELKVEVGAGAEFTECGAYRFSLWRIWRLDLAPVMLIGLNPSTANGKTDDPTIRRIRTLCRENDFGGFYMTNLFPFITPYPEELEVAKQFLVLNDVILKQVRSLCCGVVFCWGNFKTHGRDEQMKTMFPDALCFGKNANGSPKHPLYLKSDTLLKPFFDAK
jgi:hypothetical protein